MDGHVPQNNGTVIVSDILGFMLIPSLLYLNAKSFADLPVHVCSCLVVAVDVFSFSQFRAARDQAYIHTYINFIKVSRYLAKS